MPNAILIVNDEKDASAALAQALRDDFDVDIAASATEAFRLLEAKPFDVVLSDVEMTGDDGTNVMDRIVSMPMPPITIATTAHSSVATALDALRRGAYDYLPKPFELSQVMDLIKLAFRTRKLAEDRLVLQERMDTKFPFDGNAGLN